jgi:hypothetical protein
MGERRSVGGGDGYDVALVEALRGLDGGVEPPMPDLVPAARVRGARIRRRHRIGVVLVASVMAVVVAVGGHAMLTSAPAESRHPVPVAPQSVWYPSLALLQSVLPTAAGRVAALEPERPLRPGRYFRLTAPDGHVIDLYVSVARTVNGPLPAPGSRVGGFGPCESAGHSLVTVWDRLIQRCEPTSTKSGAALLRYLVGKKPVPALNTKEGGAEENDEENTTLLKKSASLGVSYRAPGGWTVQVVAGPLDEARTDFGVTTREASYLYGLTADPRLLAAAEGNGG